MGSTEKNRALEAVAVFLCDRADEILEANRADIEHAEKDGMSPSMIDRLRLSGDRLKAMAEGIRQVAALEDPVGEVISMKTRPNGLIIGQKRVPIGVIGMIYESRPNVTADAFALCFKSGNAVILRGGSDAIHSNTAIVAVIKEALRFVGTEEDSIQLVTDTDRETARQMMRLNGYIDVLIPRGGAGLIRTV